jgi:hypothetical protein
MTATGNDTTGVASMAKKHTKKSLCPFNEIRWVGNAALALLTSQITGWSRKSPEFRRGARSGFAYAHDLQFAVKQMDFGATRKEVEEWRVWRRANALEDLGGVLREDALHGAPDHLRGFAHGIECQKKAADQAKQGHGYGPLAATLHYKVYATLLANSDTIERLRRERHHCVKIFKFLIERGVVTDSRDGSGRAYTAARKLFGRLKLTHVK